MACSRQVSWLIGLRASRLPSFPVAYRPHSRNTVTGSYRILTCFPLSRMMTHRNISKALASFRCTANSGARQSIIRNQLRYQVVKTRSQNSHAPAQNLRLTFPSVLHQLLKFKQFFIRNSGLYPTDCAISGQYLRQTSSPNCSRTNTRARWMRERSTPAFTPSCLDASS